MVRFMALDGRTKELIAVASAVVTNCIPCLQWHYNKCVELGVSIEDIKEAMELATAVKNVPIKKLEKFIEKLNSD